MGFDELLKGLAEKLGGAVELTPGRRSRPTCRPPACYAFEDDGGEGEAAAALRIKDRSGLSI